MKMRTPHQYPYWEMFQDYLAGMTVMKIGEKYGCSRPTAQWICNVGRELYHHIEREAIKSFTPDELMDRLAELGYHGTITHEREL